MLDFVFILSIILEILITAFIVVKIVELEKKVILLNEKITFSANVIIEITKKLKKITQKVNKVVAIFSNKKFLMIKKIFRISLDVIQLIILLRTLNFSKGFALNIKNIKRLFMAQITKELIKRLANC